MMPRWGHALIDRALYLPNSWVADPDRCAAPGVPDRLGFATKPALATQMIGATLSAGVPTDAGPIRVDELAGMLPEHAWHRASTWTGPASTIRAAIIC